MTAGRGRLDRAWDIEKQNSQLPEASSAQLLAESQLWRHAHGAELLDEQNSDLDRCALGLSCQTFPDTLSITCIARASTQLRHCMTVQCGQTSSILIVCYRQLFAHPGQVEAARLSAEATQRQVLQALPEEVQARIKIVGTVCTDFTTFTYNQPAIVSLPGAPFAH